MPDGAVSTGMSIYGNVVGDIDKDNIGPSAGHQGRVGRVLQSAATSDGEIVGKSAPALLRAIARAHDWRERLVDGSVHNGRSIAGRSGLNQRYVRRVLQCAFLAPDIVEAILDGRQPPNLTVRKLWRDIPTDWAEQRKRLGFPVAGVPQSRRSQDAADLVKRPL